MTGFRETYDVNDIDGSWDSRSKDCPNCRGKLSHGRPEIFRNFGYRTVNGNVIPQSWCYDCRASG